MSAEFGSEGGIIKAGCVRLFAKLDAPNIVTDRS
jgi:hypothetical protein